MGRKRGVCRLTECGQPHYGLGFCKTHYNQEKHRTMYTSDAEYRARRRAGMARYRTENPEKIRQSARGLGSRYSNASKIARRRGHRFELSFEEFSLIGIQPCYACGRQPEGTTGSWLDRKDNYSGAGYTLDNVLPCCGDCNWMRGRHVPWELLPEIMKLKAAQLGCLVEEVWEKVAEIEACLKPQAA